MAKKIKLSDTRKAQIKANFSASKPPSRVNERKYWNTINAGRKRAESAFKDNTGKFVHLPPAFTNLPFIQQILKEKNTTLKEFFKDKDNLRDAKDLFNNRAVTWSYNPNSIERALINVKTDVIKINDGNGIIKMTKDEALLYIKQQQSNILQAGGYTLFFKGEYKDGFRDFTIYLENFEGLEDIEDIDEYLSDDSITSVVTSNKKGK